jgi:hypothetical protein
VPSDRVEGVVPRGRAHELVTVGDAIRAAIAELEGEGVVVTYVRTTLLPDDETCFHVLEAASPGAVERVCRRAGLDRARVVSAVEGRPEGARPPSQT